MKKIIFLVDICNCRFLIVNEKGKWNLPTLNCIYDENEIKKKFYEKYEINIRETSIVENQENYIVVKCLSDDKVGNKEKFNIGIINDIYPLVSNKIQKEILFNISLKIGFEILNDSFWLGIILTTEDKINNRMMKALLTDFLLFFSSSFCEEVLTYKFGGIKDPNSFSLKQIKDLRKKYFKKCPLYDSKSIEPIIQEMGIDFDHYIFDNVLFFINNELIDINIRTWENKNKNNFDFYNGLILSPRRWIKNFYPQLDDIFEKLRIPYVEEFVKRFNQKNFEYKSYSTYRLFNNTLSNNDKVYILLRIGLLKTTMFFSNVFGDKNFISINEQDNIKVDFDNFLLKVKATLIDLLWNDKKNNKDVLPFLERVLNNYPKEICDNFFSINRKCRDNIHYGFYNVLTDNEITILKKYQDVYLNYVISEFEKELNIKFGIGYKIGLGLAKIQYWSSH